MPPRRPNARRARGGPLQGALVALVAAACGGGPSATTPPDPAAVAPLALEVNPFVGTDLEGQTFPGAITPWGMASPSPHTRLTSIADLAAVDFFEGGLSFSGYKWGDPTIHGFGTAHLSGVGCPDLGGPVVLPFVGEVPSSFAAMGSAYRDEEAHAGHYGVSLEEWQVRADMTATPRTGVFRFRFDDPGAGPGVLVETTHGLSAVNDGGAVRRVSDRELEGHANFGFFCGQSNSGRIHFVVRVDGDTRVAESGLLRGGRPVDGDEVTGRAGGYFRFAPGLRRPVTVTVALSWVSVEGARANLEAEARPYDAALAEAEAAWQQVLSRVEIEGGRSEDRATFYTALYHAAIHPNLASDVDGGYLRFPDATPATGDPDDPRYTVFSLWDTYRGLHPLLTLLYPERQEAMLRTIGEMSLGSAPPKWELWGDEVQMMVGDPAAIVVADSLAKGLGGVDVAALFDALDAAAEDPAHRPGVEAYLSLGYVPMEEAGSPLGGGAWGPAATTLEYAFADFALARIAERAGRPERAAALDARALGYRALYDEETGTLRPRNADGSFLSPYDPDLFLTDSVAGTGGPGFVEGTAWQYAFMVPHDVEGLVALHGGPAPFTARLDALFEEGRFTVYNEPDLGYPYLYTYLDGQAEKTQRLVRELLATRFGPGPDGIEGNDDAGTMSAWIVFSSLGLYPATPGLPEYRLGSPSFDRVTLHLSERHFGGADFVLEAPGAEAGATVVAQTSLDGAPLERPVLSHADLVRGGTLRFELRAEP